MASKCTQHHLPKRDELSLYTVLALPKLSRRREDSSAASVAVPEEPESSASESKQSLQASVFPAPLSPEMRIDCARNSPSEERPVMPLKATDAARATCGGASSPSLHSRVIDSALQFSTGWYGFIEMITGPIAVKISLLAYRRRKVSSIVASWTSASCVKSSSGTASDTLSIGKRWKSAAAICTTSPVS